MTDSRQREPRGFDEPRRIARMAGALYVLVIIAPVSMLLRQGIIVPGDVAATTSNLLARGPMFRVSVLIDLVGIICYLGVTGLLYFLFRAAGRALAFTAMLFSLTGCIVSIVGLLTLAGPVAGVTTGAHRLSPELALLPLQWRSFFFQSAMTMFGLYCVLTGMLILRSRFMPRVIGPLMILAGLCYLVYCSIALLAPPVAERLFPTILLPGLIGEGALTLWLLLRGVDPEQWHRQLRGPDATPTADGR
jgi:uncharacterized membrane protein